MHKKQLIQKQIPIGSYFHPDYMFCGECTTCSTTTTTTTTSVSNDSSTNNNNDDNSSNNKDNNNNDSNKDKNNIIIDEKKQQQQQQQQQQQDVVNNNYNNNIDNYNIDDVAETSHNDITETSTHHDNFDDGDIELMKSLSNHDRMMMNKYNTKKNKKDKKNNESNNNNNNNINNNNDDTTNTTTTTTTNLVRSTLHVQGICCASEVPAVKRILHPYQVQINITAKRVYVKHDPNAISINELSDKLNSCGFGASIIQDGAKARLQQQSLSTTDSILQTQKRSKYVESTIQVSNLDYAHECLLPQIQQYHFKSKLEVRSMYRVISHSNVIKVEHNPELISIQSIINLLNEYGLDIIIITDGYKEQLYLPEIINEDNEDNNSNNNIIPIEENGSNTIHWNVILSGIFWIISMIGAIFNIKILEYMGLLSVVFGIPPVAYKAYLSIRRYELDANGMMVIAAIGAVLVHEYDEAASVSFLFAISEYLEYNASSRARLALQTIIQLRPEHASLVINNNTTIIIPADQVPINSIISVRTGDKIAADGIVIEGTSSIDNSSLTGESVPVQVTIGNKVVGGAINVGNTQLLIQTTVSTNDSAVSRLIHLIEEAQANSSPTEKLVDRFAKTYTPIIIIIAFLLATIPWLWGYNIGKIYTMKALILIVIACPCALTISTPVTYAAGLAATAQKGIVCKGGATLEACGCIHTIPGSYVILDKTGTITEGKFAVSAMKVIGTKKTRQEMLGLLALMEAPSSHPLSNTLVQAAKLEGVAMPTDVQVKEHTVLKGEGVTASVDGKQVYVGNRRLFERIGMYNDIPEKYKNMTNAWSADQGGTVGFIGIEDDGIIGCFCVTDVVRPEAKETINDLRMNGVQVLMLTGDGDGAAKAIAKQVGLPDDAVHSQLLPEDKLQFVSSLKVPGSNTLPFFGLFHHKPTILFCGDGINDGPAIACADVGVSMGEGAAALAMEMSDVTLMDSNLSKLNYTIQMGARVLTTIRENILLSLFCKAVVVILTFAGYMTLFYAIVSDVGVMLLVTLNGMKLLPSRRGDDNVSISSSNSRTIGGLFNSRKRYSFIPTGNTHNSSNVAELNDDLI